MRLQGEWSAATAPTTPSTPDDPAHGSPWPPPPCPGQIITKFDSQTGDELINSKYLNGEIEILKAAGSHPNILEIYDVYETEHFVYVVIELATGGSLLDVIKRHGSFAEKDAAFAVRQVADALGFLHANGIVHRDIKVANLLVADSSSFVIKVSDFGLSKAFSRGKITALASGRELAESAGYIMRSACGSASYAAPELYEVLEQSAYGEEIIGSYDQSIDVWGLGMVMCILVSGRHPLQGVPEEEVLPLLWSGGVLRFDSPEWDDVSDAARELVSGMLAPKPQDRLTPQQILCHPWIANDAAPSTPLPHVLEGARRLQLAGLQKLVLQVMETHVPQDELVEMDRLFNEVARDSYIDRAAMRHVLASLPTGAGSQRDQRWRQQMLSMDLCFDKLDLDGTGVISLKVPQSV